MEKGSTAPRKVVSGKLCVVCKQGEIVHIISKRFNEASGSLILGPGSARQFVDTHGGLHCETCGVKYEFVPPIAEDMAGTKPA